MMNYYQNMAEQLNNICGDVLRIGLMCLEIEITEL